MEFRVLGPVEIHSSGRIYPVGPPQQRLVLAALALEASRPVPVQVLIDRVWDEAPQGARRTLHVLLTRIRRLLAQIGEDGEDGVELIRRSGGYALLAQPEKVDAHRVLQAVRQARGPDCTTAGRVRLLREALAQWQGEPLAGLPGQWADRTRQAWQQRRIDVIVGWAQAEIEAGDPAAVLGPVTELSADYPLLEPLAAARMLALAATGRGAEALEEYMRISTLLAQEIGAEPGAELRSVHLAVLRGQVSATEPASLVQTPAARRTLPADLAVFVGRRAQLDAMSVSAVHETVTVYAIEGMPGIGKTALAVHIGHCLAGEFPDGQLFLNLRAHTPGQRPMPPADALAELLTADGIDPRLLPSTLDARAALWRERLTGRRMLLVLDNAAGTEQVAPLLPGSPGCLVLITSRRSLTDLPAAIPVPVEVMETGEASEMFLRLAPHAAADRDAVADLVRACGHLPLAVSIAASMCLRHRSWTVGDLLHEIRRSAERILTVAAEDRTVAAVFDLSYQHLPQDRRRFFRLIGLHPGTDLDTYAAAALAGIPLCEAEEHLDRLHRDHLLDEPCYLRYRMHDLIRAYAQNCATETDPAGTRQHAIDRLLDYYAQTAARADAHVARFACPPQTSDASSEPHSPSAMPPLADWKQASTWLRAERANLMACLHYATEHGDDARAIGLAAGLAGTLCADGPWSQAVAVHEAATSAAQRIGDPHALARARHDLGVAHRLAGDYRAAAHQLEESLEIFRAASDRHGQSKALHGLGVTRRHTGDYRSAAAILAQALELHRLLGDRRGQAHSLDELGVVYCLSSSYPEAAEALEQALDLYLALGDRRGQANTLRGLADVHRDTGNYLDAGQLLSKALELHREVGDQLGGAYDLRRLGVVKSLTGDYSDAAYLLGEARRLHRDLGDRLGEASAMNELGVVRCLTGDHDGAAELLRQSVQRYRALGDRHGEAISCTHLATAACMTDDYRGAAEFVNQALSLYRALGSRHGLAFAGLRLAVTSYRSGDHASAAQQLHESLTVFRDLGAADDEAEALNHLGTVHRLSERPDQALVLHRQALDVAVRIHYRLEEAHALEGLGRATLDLGDRAAGIGHLHDALGLYRRLGVPEAQQVAADLAVHNAMADRGAAEVDGDRAVVGAAPGLSGFVSDGHRGR